ncbi:MULTISPECIES: hypothetical protein [unclassified Bradyrhizobium]|uniref:hypothetical protein n=1 Tax=unclassified Bradyrhizobium TaxID=2631580 RepID=UPI00201264EB|nr:MULTISPECIES: hypothetical protein [unclassified Bradyrhizobium]
MQATFCRALSNLHRLGRVHAQLASRQGEKDVRKADVTCACCGAGFRRLELWSEPGAKGEYHCPVCDYLLEAFDGTNLIVYRLTIQPVRAPVYSVRQFDDRR